MKWIGLTGGIGTGKSTVAQILHQKGIPIVDADLQSHKALEKPHIQEKILHHFDEKDISFVDTSTHQKKIDRKALAQVIFNDFKKKTLLEDILHPEIAHMANQEKKALLASNKPLAIYDVPLLFEKNMQSEFDKTVLVASDQRRVFQRLQKRGIHPKALIEQIMRSQIPQQQKLKMADFVIWNNDTLKALESKCQQLLKDINKATFNGLKGN